MTRPASDALLTVADLVRQLGISRRSVYRIAFLRQRAIYPQSSPRWYQSDVDLYLAQRRGMAWAKRKRRSA